MDRHRFVLRRHFHGLWLSLALSSVPWSVMAQTNEVFVCVDDSGTRTYQNTGGGKGCKRMNLEPLTSIPAPRQVQSQPPSPGGANNNPSSADKSAGNRSSTGAKYNPAQLDRDFDRRRILEEEVRREESRLTELKAEYNNGEPVRNAGGAERNYQLYLDRVARMRDEVTRTEGNLEALRRELSRIPGGQ